MAYSSTQGYVLVAQGAGAVSVYSAPKAFLWTSTTLLAQTLLVQNAYIVDSPGACILTLPLTSNLGDTIKIVAKNANPVTIAQNKGQQIVVDYNTASVVGILGSLINSNKYDTVELTCITPGLASVWLADLSGKWKVV